MPGFCKTIFIIELVFCCIRTVLVLGGIVGLLNMVNVPPRLQQTVIFEVSAGAGIAVFGIFGMGLLLARKDMGVVLGYLDVVSTIGSLIVAVWQLSILAENVPPGSPERIGMYVGGGITLLIRLALIGLLIAAMMKYRDWKACMQPSTKSEFSPYQ